MFFVRVTHFTHFNQLADLRIALCLSLLIKLYVRQFKSILTGNVLSK